MSTRDVHGLDSSMDWIGLDWIGSDWIGSNSGECCVDWIGLGQMTVMYKILTAYVFLAKQTKTVLCSLIISDFLHT